MQPFVEPDYLPALPELFLAGASVTLLMAGVFIGDRSTRLMTWLACVAMAVAFVMVLVAPRRADDDLLRPFRGRSLRRVHEMPGAGRRSGHAHHRNRLRAARGNEPLRVPGADRLRHARHAADDFGERPDRALCGARAAEPLALHRRRVPPRLGALDRGGAQVFRAGRNLLRPSALRLLHGLRLHRRDRIRGDRRSADHHRAGQRGGRDRRPDRARVHRRGIGLQGLGGALPHVDAGCLRGRADSGHRILRRSAQGRRHGAAAQGLSSAPSTSSPASGTRS